MINMQEMIKSKKFIIASVALGVIIVALVSFATGVFVGFHKARFSYKFGENYERNFMGPRQNQKGPIGMMRDKFRDFEGNFTNTRNEYKYICWKRYYR